MKTLPFIAQTATRKTLGTSWRTSALGWIAIARGLWLFKIAWVPTNTIAFNLNYATLSAQLFIVVGLALLFARDNKVTSEQAFGGTSSASGGTSSASPQKE